jgi:hypothetical protein
MRARLVLLLLLCSSARADEGFGVTRFALPDGWKRTDRGDLVTLAPAGETGVGIALYADVPRHGDFEAWFHARVAEAHRGVNVVSEAPLTRGHDAGFEVIHGGARVKERDGSVSVRAYLAAAPGDRFVFAVYFAASAASFEQHGEALEQFLHSIHFANLPPGAAAAPAAPGAPAVQPGPGDGGLDGLYVGSQNTSGFDAQSKMWLTRTVKKELFFTPAGWVLYGPFTSAVEDLDPAAAKRDVLGVYRVEGDKVAVRWADGTSAALELSARDHLVYGQAQLWKCARLKDLRLDGTYGFRSFVDTAGAAGSGGVSGEHTITFAKDGTFTTTDFAGFVGANAAGSSGTAGAGRYRIDGYALELSAGGAHARHTFFLYAGDEKKAHPGIIEIDGTGYLAR